MQSELSQFFARATEDPLAEAFEKRSPMIPWQGMSPVPEHQLAETWERVRQIPRKGKTVAYVHVPFCANHCLFCGFYRNSSRNDFSAVYVDRVIAEIETEADTPMVQGAPVHAVYLGGGTPTDLEAGDLARLIRTLRRRLPLAPDCEITVEGRPTGFSPEKIEACLEAGANRFSLGVQSFDTKVRRNLGRKMDQQALMQFLRLLCERDRASVVCDLIFGLPGQTRESWRRDLEICGDIGLDGVDLYCLTILPGSPLSGAVRQGTLHAAPITEQASLYRDGVELLERKGWRQLTGAHWAAGTRERNLYNQLIKAGANCLAYGAGAGGAVGKYSYVVAPDLKRYHVSGDTKEKCLAALFLAGCFQDLKAEVTNGLELGRLDLAPIEAKGAERFLEFSAPLVAQWQEAGLVQREGSIMRLTMAGRFWHTNLAVALHALLGALPACASKQSGPEANFAN